MRPVKRKDGRWAARLHLGYENGRRLSKWVYSSVSAADCQARLDAERERVRHGLRPSDGRWTVNDQAASWLANQAIAIAPTSFARWETVIRVHIAPLIGERPLSRIGVPDVMLVRNEAVRTLAPNTVRQVVGVLSMILRSAVREGAIARNPAEWIKLPEVIEKADPELSPAELSRLLLACEEHRFGAIVALAIGSGMRQGEILALRRDDINLSAGTVRVDEGLQSIPRSVRGDGKRLQVGKPKTKTSRRIVYVAPFAMRRLERHLAETPIHKDGLVFYSVRGNLLDRKDLLRDFQRLLADLGLPRLRFHALRGIYATALATAGVDHAVIRAQLGHGKRDVTDHYARVLPELQRAAADRLEEALG